MDNTANSRNDFYDVHIVVVADVAILLFSPIAIAIFIVRYYSYYYYYRDCYSFNYYMYA